MGLMLPLALVALYATGAVIGSVAAIRYAARELAAICPLDHSDRVFLAWWGPLAGLFWPVFLPPCAIWFVLRRLLLWVVARVLPDDIEVRD